MQWYFLSDTQEQVPVNEDHIAGLVQTGVIRPYTMIWHDGMPEWVSASEVKPELFANRHLVPVVGAAATARQTAALHPQQAAAQITGRIQPGAPAATAQMHAAADAAVVREAATAFGSGAGWMKFVGVLFVIGGVAYVLAALFILVSGMAVEGAAMAAILFAGVTAAVGGIVLWMGILLFQAAGKSQEAVRTGQKHTLTTALRMNGKFFKIWGISVITILVVYGLIFALFFAVLTTIIGGAAATQTMNGKPGIATNAGDPDDPESETEQDDNNTGADGNNDDFERIDEDPKNDDGN